jgi:hypothetical protein
LHGEEFVVDIKDAFINIIPIGLEIACDEVKKVHARQEMSMEGGIVVEM